jgi:hypothetical protein
MPANTATPMSPAIFLMNNASSHLGELCDFLHSQSVNLHQASGISPEQILNDLDKIKPSIILLGLDASENQETFAICDQLKQQKRYRELPLILISDDDSQELILKGYQHGATEVIYPPYYPQAVFQKLTVHQQQQNTTEKLKEKIQDNKNTALAAMKDSSELGKVIQFFENSVLCQNFGELTQRIFQLFKEMELNSAVLVHPKMSITNYFSDDKKFHPIELKLLQQFREVMVSNPSGSRFFTFHQRILAHSKNVTLLVRNCPNDDLQQGRIRDILGAIINGLDQRCGSIQHEQDKLEKNIIIKEVIKITETNIRALHTLSDEHGKKTIAIMDNLSNRLGSGLAILGLSEQQEDFFIQLLDTAMQELVGLQSEEIQIEKNFAEVLTMLNTLTEEL